MSAAPVSVKVAGAVLLLLPMLALAQLVETRECGQPRRNSAGEIVRRADVLRAFRRLHPCPSTGKTSGACPDWSIDHVWPLASCGCDAVPNMQWLPNATKSAAGTLPKDRWERRVYRCGESR